MTQTGGVRMTNRIKRLSGAIAMLAALGGLIGFLSGKPSPPEAIAAAEGAAPAHQPNPAWTAPDQEAAKKRAQEIVPFVEAVLEECQLCRQMRLRETRLGIKDITNSYFLLDSPIIKKSEDLYGPVRFKHSKHAAQLKDCALCHHRRPIDASAKETTRCSACHQEAFRSDQPERLGLKAAFHQQCTGCHQDMKKGPTDCLGCHNKNVPDHKELVKLSDKPQPTEVTQECLRCHKGAGEDMLKTAHWLWKGPSPYTLNRSKHVEHGKATTAVNNF
jgi:hypothetical protein